MQKAYAIWLTYINSYGEGACSLATRLMYVTRSVWAFCIMAQVFIMAGCYVWFPIDGNLLARRLFPGVAA